MKGIKIKDLLGGINFASILIGLGVIGTVSAQNFVFTSGNTKYDRPFADAKANIVSNTKSSGAGTVFHAGAFWDQVWTRDGSYSIEMACGHIDPVTSRSTFNYITTTWNGMTVQLQDVCGHFGGWPALTDGIVWATGAWAFYRQTGDASFLSYAYPIIRNSLLRAETEVRDPSDGLFKGCSSFMESNSGYPGSFANSGAKVGATKAGSTNMLHYHAYVIADSMAKLLAKPQSTLDSLNSKIVALKNAINSNLWNASKGYYYYFKNANGTYQPQNEGLADAFAILYDIADSAKKASILTNTIPSAWGTVCQYPQYPEWMDYSKGDADYYHSNMIWPFVQGYMAWAAAKMKNQTIFMNELDKCAQLWAKSNPGEFREFYRPLDGTPDGGGQQLWSASGYITMVIHGLFGMNFDVDGIRFDPIVPDTFKTAMTLNNFIYRKDTLNMTITGPGKYLQTFKLDGVTQKAFIPGTLTGKHTVVMTVSNSAVGILPQARNAAMVNNRIQISSSSIQGVSMNFGSYQNVDAALYSLAGKIIGEFNTSNGIVTVSNKSFIPGSYIVKWHSGDVEGIQKVLLK
jgi:hypothetical protein